MRKRDLTVLRLSMDTLCIPDDTRSVFRLDLGWQKTFTTGRVEHTVNVGVCLERNRPLMPILPYFSWRVTFCGNSPK